MAKCVPLIFIVAVAWMLWQPVRRARLDHALIAAVKKNDLNGVRVALKQGANPNALDIQENTRPFWRALQSLFLREKTSSPRDMPVLMVAFSAWWKPEGGSDEPPQNTVIIEALLRAGANIHVRDTEGDTPLLEAALSHRLGLVKRLLRLGAELNTVDDYGRTALSYMNPDGYQNILADREIYRLLQKAGAKE